MEDEIVIAEYPTIYCRDKKGKVREFRQKVTCLLDNEFLPHLIESETGLQNGKLTLSTVTVKEGKNKGKSNETSPKEQAKLEADSRFKEKLVEGYKTLETISELYANGKEVSPETVTKYLPTFNTDHNNRVKPMLANKAKGYKKTYENSYAQYKLNGVRCRAMIDNDKVILVSREGIIYSVPYLEESIALRFYDKLVEGFVLDGEIYVHGWNLERIASAVKKYSFDTAQLEFHIYDIIPPYYQTSLVTQKVRKGILENHIFPVCKSSNFLIPVQFHLITCEEDYYNLFKQAREEKYEGIMVRLPNTIYEAGFRSSGLLKVKDRQSTEVTIIGANKRPGSPAHDFVWLCRTKDNKDFEVKPHGTESKRAQYWENHASYIGKKLQLEFIEYTKNKIPFHITDVVVRDYE